MHFIGLYIIWIVWTYCILYIFYRKRNRYDWSRFRAISRLDKKFDETMTEYFKAFYAMCKRVCGLKLTEEEGEYSSFTVIKISSVN
jgi:chromodomain-helicase-DNA-binding protein 7